MPTVRYLVEGNNTHGLTDVVLTVFSESNVVTATLFLSEISNTGIYSSQLAASSNSWGLVECASLNIRSIVRLFPTTSSIYNMVYGGGEQIGSQLVCYSPPPNVTEIARFNLYDANGNLTTNMNQVVKQVRV